MPTDRQGRMLTKNDIMDGLSELDVAFEAAELLMSVTPIRFVTIGGMLAVSLFQNRMVTKDIDFLLDPNIDAVVEYRDEVLRVIQGVARMRGFNSDWMNDELKIFIQSSNRLNLFLQSVEQGIIVYQGQNLIVYAGRLDFALERKLRRVDERSSNRSRELDLSDAVTLVHYIKGDGHPLSWKYVQGLDENGLGVKVGDAAIQATAIEYVRVYSTQGIVDMVWDETYQGWKYTNLEGEWMRV
ncbi:uncharacterized protein MAM_06961 [Metarhizium album ARSEF 1941]|uniref:Uncharacterized protein n=1 Tax=Metarhizium album (strain ARSEF 1941) TaxID=1081103 RepID=A0A0B2WQL2_METAS|nr:uncharacterized protein MAM_06961 [Metarhizium album ARSEF 1941]KHN95250.1 hypothetical protein MAM_06961 [Metarhizium album ARSEF 1941]